MKRIFVLLLALAMTLSLTAFAGEFNAGVTIKTDKNGNTTITVQDSDLYEKQNVTLTVACSLNEAYVVYEGKAVESSLDVNAKKITFSVIGGGTYTIKEGTPSEDELPATPTFTVTYTDGVDGAMIFEDQTYTVDQDSATPAFSGTPTRAGYTFKGWSPEVAETVTADVTYAAQWEINKYTLTWSNGDDGSYEQELVYGATITVPDNEFFNDTMRKAGHTLTGWTNAENYEVGASMPAQALTFTAQYTVNTYTVTYTDGVDGAEIFKDQTSTVAYGAATPSFSGTPSRTGYTFKGWSPAVADTVTGNATYVAQWEINKYTLTWSNGDGGSYEQELVYGATITVPDNEFFSDTMRKAGHTLTGWTNAENYEVGASMPAQALTFTAQYTVNTYTVTYTDGVDGSVIFADQAATVAYGAAIPAFNGTPSRTGYTFKGWDTEVPATMPAKALAFNATWSINQYTITFTTDGGSAVAPITQDYNTAVTAPAAPTKTGYTFAGWKTADGTDFTFSGFKMGAENITLTAKWNPATGTAYTVNHHYQNIENDDYTAEAETKHGVTESNTAAEAKTVTGFTAGEITQKPIKADGSTVIDIYYTRNTHTLTFKPENGEADITSTVKFGAPITAPAAPVKTGYTFIGWGEVASTMPDQDVTYTAKWEIKKHTVIYTDGVDHVVIFADQSTTVDYGSETPAFSGTPVRPGYRFNGWKPAVSELVTADATYVAQWIRNPSSSDKPSKPSVEEKPVQPEEPCVEPPFTDIQENDWFYADVAWVYEKGLMNGTGADAFSPNATTSRGMIVTILWRLEGMPAAGACTFQDVKPGAYYEQAIAWAAENGIVNGYGKDSFRPDGTITREQFATILYRYAKDYKGFNVSVGEDTNILSFSDAFSISDYAFSSLQWACGSGLMNGSGDSLMPGGSATRAQAAALLHRFCENVK